MTTIDYGPDVADLRTRLAGAHTEIGRLQDECLRIAEERDARPDITHDDARCLVAWIDDRDSMMSRDVRRATEALVELGTHAKGGE